MVGRRGRIAVLRRARRRLRDELVQRSPTGQFSRSSGSGTWEGFAIVDGGAARVEITCAGDATASMPSTSIEVGPAPSIRSFGLGLAATVLIPLVLGGLGFVVLLVTGILWSTRAATQR